MLLELDIAGAFDSAYWLFLLDTLKPTRLWPSLAGVDFYPPVFDIRVCTATPRGFARATPYNRCILRLS